MVQQRAELLGHARTIVDADAFLGRRGRARAVDDHPQHLLAAFACVAAGGFAFRWLVERERGQADHLLLRGEPAQRPREARAIGGLSMGSMGALQLAINYPEVFGAVAHIMEHAQEFGGDASRIFLTGDSAGGNLSAVQPPHGERASMLLHWPKR